MITLVKTKGRRGSVRAIYTPDPIGQAPREWTALHEAARAGDVGRLLAALTTGVVPVNSVDEMGQTPLLVAVRHHRFAVVRSLLDFGASPDVPDAFGMTARRCARRAPARLRALFGLPV
jgi:ankyrin repeat protein